MNLVTRFAVELHRSRRRDATRVVNRYRHLIAQARAYDRARDRDTAGSASRPRGHESGSGEPS